MFGTISTFALVAGLAAAIHEPVGEPSGNAIITPATDSIVPACKPFTITWTPTTPNKVSWQLLRGPSTNIVPLGAPIAEGVENSGSLTWTPAADLEADTTHYGLRIIDDVTGQYQWSGQFGISKEDCGEANTTTSSSSSSSSASSTSSETPSSTPSLSSSLTSAPATITPPATTGHGNSTIVLPTGNVTVPTTLQPSASLTPTSSGPVIPTTGAAGHIQAGLGLAGAIAGLVMML